MTASYHTSLPDSVPKRGWKVKELREWLHKEGIPFKGMEVKRSQRHKKDELYELARAHLKEKPQFRVEEIAAKYGHTILRVIQITAKI